MRTSIRFSRKAAASLTTLGGALLLGTSAWASGGGSGHGIDPAMVTDLILRVFNFTVFAAIMLKLTVKPIKQFFASRKEEIATTLDSLEKQKMAAQKALKAAKAELAAVEAQREGIIEQFIAEGEAEKEKILKKAEMAAERIKEMAQLTIDAEVRKSAEALKREIVEAAVQLGEQLLKDNIMPDDQQRLVDDYVTKVVEAH